MILKGRLMQNFKRFLHSNLLQTLPTPASVGIFAFSFPNTQNGFVEKQNPTIKAGLFYKFFSFTTTSFGRATWKSNTYKQTTRRRLLCN